MGDCSNNEREWEGADDCFDFSDKPPKYNGTTSAATPYKYSFAKQIRVYVKDVNH